MIPISAWSPQQALNTFQTSCLTARWRRWARFPRLTVTPIIKKNIIADITRSPRFSAYKQGRDLSRTLGPRAVWRRPAKSITWAERANATAATSVRPARSGVHGFVKASGLYTFWRWQVSSGCYWQCGARVQRCGSVCCGKGQELQFPFCVFVSAARWHSGFMLGMFGWAQRSTGKLMSNNAQIM